MAYADALRSSNWTGSDVADLIDGAIVKSSASAESTTVTSTTSTSFVTSSVSVDVTVASGDVVVLGCYGNSSHSNDNFTVGVRIHRNGSAFGREVLMQSQAASTTGQRGNFCLFQVDNSPPTGTVTYAIYFRETVGSGTAYLDDRVISAAVLRKA